MIEICQIRLDFDKFSTTVATTGICTDSFDVTGPTNTNALTVLCGTLTGQHCKYKGVFTCSILKSIVTILESIVVIRTSI